jgi:branched-chain amino acid transport system permease protein
MLRLDRSDEAKLLSEAARQIERVGLGDQMHQLAGSLSLGQQRIVEIARALCVHPLLLLLDEPAAGLRHMEKQKLSALLRQLRSEGMSVLLVEHDMGFVMDIADRIVVLEFGTKIAEGTPSCHPHQPRSDQGLPRRRSA